MHVVRLELTDFRNYPSHALDLGPGCSVLIGANGQGKTNLVEAIGYAATLGSHRVASDAPLVRTGAERAVIGLAVRRGGRSASLDLTITPGKGTRARLNGAALPRARDCLGLVRAVVFAPEDLALVKGDPDQRRRFMDGLLSMLTPRMAGVLADLDRVLRQRGALLRAVARRGGRPDAGEVATLSVWDDQLATIGGQVLTARVALVEQLREPFSASYRQLAGESDRAAMEYRSSIPWRDAGGDAGALAAIVAQELRARHAEEFRRGANLTGPQRDDLDLVLSDRPAKGYASHGECWSLALSLRLAAYQVLLVTAIDYSDPILILDDVFAELDRDRRQRLADAVAGAEQVLITAAAVEDVPGELDGRRYEVTAGSVREAPVAIAEPGLVLP